MMTSHTPPLRPVRGVIVALLLFVLPAAALAVNLLAAQSGEVETSAGAILDAVLLPIYGLGLIAVATAGVASGGAGLRDAARLTFLGRASDAVRAATTLRRIESAWIYLAAATSILAMLVWVLAFQRSKSNADLASPAALAGAISVALLAPMGPLLLGRIVLGSIADEAAPRLAPHSWLDELVYLLFFGPIVAQIVLTLTPLQ